MRDLRFKICGQVDDLDGFEWASKVGAFIRKRKRQVSRKSHFLTHIPQPMQRNSEMKAILSVGLTSIHILPV